MINKTLRKQLKKQLKNKWIDDVISELATKKILDKKGKPYSKSFISHVYNGLNSNFSIENAIVKVYENRKINQSKMIAEIKNKLK